MAASDEAGTSVNQVHAWITAGERYDVEFKGEHRDPLNDRELVEAVVCLSNGSGGVLLVGVEDDGTPTGARPRHESGRTDVLRLQALIANNTQPPVATSVSIVDLDGVPVIVVEIPDSPRVVGTTRGTYLRRAVGGDGRPTCVPYHAHEMLAHEVDRGAVDYASLPVHGATWEDLDPVEFERVRRLVTEASGRADSLLAGLSDREIAHALGMVRANAEVTTGALLLFGRSQAIRRFLPTHEAAFQIFRGLEVEVNDFFTDPLFRLAEEVFSRFRARNREEELQFGLLRVAVPAYSETAFREALANALTHRDYTRRGAMHVQWNSEQLEVSSPGGFPEGIRLDNLLVAAPHPRSPLLADAFKRTGLVERTGRGINRMFAEQLRVGRPAPDYGRSTNQQVVAVLPGGPANLSLTRWVLEQERQGDRPLTVPRTAGSVRAGPRTACDHGRARSRAAADGGRGPQPPGPNGGARVGRGPRRRQGPDMASLRCRVPRSGSLRRLHPGPWLRAATRDRDGRWIGGSVDQWVGELTGVVLDHGASGLILFSPSGDTPVITSLSRWAREIVPAVREAIAKEMASSNHSTTTP